MDKQENLEPIRISEHKTWLGSLLLLLSLNKEGNEKGKAFAMQELIKMAKCADRHDTG